MDPILDPHLGSRGGRSLKVGLVSKLSNLETVDLSGTAITAAGVEQLAALSKLNRLSLWNAKGIGDSAAGTLASMKALAVLDLSGTALSDRGLDNLSRSASLRLIYLSGTKVTAEGANRCRGSHPDCRVSWVTLP